MDTYHHPSLPIAVRDVAIDHPAARADGLDGLAGYRQAFVILRRGGSVVGQAWLPVTDGAIPQPALQAAVAEAAWPVWLADGRGTPAELPTATVVICTRDRTAELARGLPRLAELAAAGHEVLVVDNAPSDDGTARLVARYPAIRYVLEPRGGLDIARNTGLRRARGEIVAFTDDDAVVDPGWLPALLRNFADPNVAIVTGITMPLEIETAAQYWFERTNGFGRGFVRREVDTHNFNPLGSGGIGAGVNMAIRRRAALDHIGLFDEALDCGTVALTGGDQEFVYRALARGYRVVYEPAALVRHGHRADWAGLRKTVHSYGVGLYAWWFRALLVERELSVLSLAPRWFWQHHVRQVAKALLRRGKYVPLDLAVAELRGTLIGPQRYLRARRLLRAAQDHAISQPTVAEPVAPEPIEVV